MINICFFGDFAPSIDLLDSVAVNGSNEYFADFQYYFNEADYCVANLECPIIDTNSPAVKYGPILSTDNRSIELLKKANINIVALANNHIMDHGLQGLTSTIRYIEKGEIDYLGAGFSNEAAKTPLIVSKNGLDIGILNFSENEFSNTDNELPGASPLDFFDNIISIKRLKKTVDFLIVIVHGGTELHDFPSPYFQKILRYFAEIGADLVIAHHTHRYNGFEIYESVPIFYGLGNFIFPMINNSKPDIKWSTGIMLNVKIDKNKSITFVTVPFLQNHGNKFCIQTLKGDQLQEFRIYENNINQKIKNINALKQEYEKFYEKNKNKYLHFLQPFTSRYLHKLFSIGLLPSFLENKRKRLLYLNLVRCEAHRDLLLKILSEDEQKISHS